MTKCKITDFFRIKTCRNEIDYNSIVFHYLFIKRIFLVFCFFFCLITPDYRDLIVIQMSKLHLNTHNETECNIMTRNDTLVV